MACSQGQPRVTGFVGGGNHPVPLTADEVNQILYREGPFTSLTGKVDEIGRATPVELEFGQVEKVQ